MTTIKITDPTGAIRTFEGATPMRDLVIDLMNRSDWVILDTETTGLDHRAEAVSIGVIDPNGNVLLDTLVKPTRPITPDVTAINGVTNEMLSNAPTFLDVLPLLHNAVENKTIVVYNAPYDHRIIKQSFQPYLTIETSGEPLAQIADIASAAWLDVMAPYAEFWGDWNDYHQSYKWQKITAAAAQQGVVIKDAHRAVGDCQMTLGLIKAVWELKDGELCVECGNEKWVYEGRCKKCVEKLYRVSFDEIIRLENDRLWD